MSSTLCSVPRYLYLSKLQNVFVQNTKCICPNQITKCFCPNYKMYLSKSQNVFVQNTKCICPNQITKFICLDCSALIVVIWMCSVPRYKEGGGRYLAISEPPYTYISSSSFSLRQHFFFQRRYHMVLLRDDFKKQTHGLHSPGRWGAPFP